MLANIIHIHLLKFYTIDCIPLLVVDERHSATAAQIENVLLLVAAAARTGSAGDVRAQLLSSLLRGSPAQAALKQSDTVCKCLSPCNKQVTSCCC